MIFDETTFNYYNQSSVTAQQHAIRMVISETSKRALSPDELRCILNVDYYLIRYINVKYINTELLLIILEYPLTYQFLYRFKSLMTVDFFKTLATNCTNSNKQAVEKLLKEYFNIFNNDEKTELIISYLNNISDRYLINNIFNKVFYTQLSNTDTSFKEICDKINIDKKLTFMNNLFRYYFSSDCNTIELLEEKLDYVLNLVENENLVGLSSKEDLVEFCTEIYFVLKVYTEFDITKYQESIFDRIYLTLDSKFKSPLDMYVYLRFSNMRDIECFIEKHEDIDMLKDLIEQAERQIIFKFAGVHHRTHCEKYLPSHEFIDSDFIKKNKDIRTQLIDLLI